MRRSPRQLWWGGLFLSSLIAMGSTFEAVKVQRYYAPPTATQRWAVGSATATFLLTFLSLALQTIPKMARLLMGTKLELALIFVASAFTCASVGTATNPATGMAINALGGVSFGNLYYSVWASFGCGIALLISFMRTERGVDVSSELKSRGNRFRMWAIMIVTTLIVMGSSASSYDAKCGEDEEFIPMKYCRRAAFGVSAGCIGCVGCLAVVAMRLSCTRQENGEGRPNKIIFLVECIASMVLLCFFCFAVAYLTSEEGPGAPLGNLYYSTWISFLLVLFVGVSCFEEFQKAKSIYSLETQQVHQQIRREEEVSSTVSNRGRPVVDWRERENIMEAEANPPVRMTPPDGMPPGSVGEVSLAD
ncbi:hypothetical protein ACHAWF_010524 [Thalassiosira exigua]